MIKIKNQPYNSVWISADTQDELGNTFLRFQEFYESPNPDFKNKIFTVGQVRAWYSEKYGADTYHSDWTGFNFPSYVLAPFRQGLFDPLTKEETILLDYLRYRYDNFYIIGAQDKATLRHELAHALYASDVIYKRKIDQLCYKFQKDLKVCYEYILEKGYHKDVIYDELQAYITDNEDEFIIKNLPKKIIDLFNKTYNIHNKANI